MEFNRVFYIDNLPIKIDNKLLLTRLSYKKGKTDVNADFLTEIEKTSCLALDLSKPCGAYSIVHLSNEHDNLLYMDGFRAYSDFLSHKMSEACGAVLMAVTLGSAADDRINQFFIDDEYTTAVILDAAASCIADSAVEALKDHIDKKLAEDGLKTGDFRISPGQAGLDVNLQKIIYDRLSLDKTGISINDKMMLLPQKSVISLTGVFKHKK